MIKGDKKILNNNAILKSLFCECTETTTDNQCLAIITKSAINKDLIVLNDELRKRKSPSNTINGNFRLKRSENDGNDLVFEYCYGDENVVEQSSEWLFNGLPKKQIKLDEKEDFKIKYLKNESKALETFVITQIFHKPKSHFTKEEQKVFLKYYYKSPSLYRQMVDDGFKMPSLSTIFRWHGSYSLTPGINPKTLNMLKEKCQSMKDGDEQCVLLFDEMAIKKELELRTTDDSVYGYVDFGEFGKKNIIANKALVMMIRGIKKNWKRSFCYCWKPQW